MSAKTQPNDDSNKSKLYEEMFPIIWKFTDLNLSSNFIILASIRLIQALLFT